MNSRAKKLSNCKVHGVNRFVFVVNQNIYTKSQTQKKQAPPNKQQQQILKTKTLKKRQRKGKKIKSEYLPS